MYSVHRINPQCVLTNITQLPQHWYEVSVEKPARPPLTRSDPRLQALEPQLRHHAGLSSGRVHIHVQTQKQTLDGVGSRTQKVRACSRDLMLSSETRGGGGSGDEPETVSFIYNQVRSLWLMLVPQESGLWQHAGKTRTYHLTWSGWEEK